MSLLTLIKKVFDKTNEAMGKIKQRFKKMVQRLDRIERKKPSEAETGD